MFGAIFGDILGSKFEFLKPEEIKKNHNIFDFQNIFPTDDTIMTIAIADALLNLRKLATKNSPTDEKVNWSKNLTDEQVKEVFLEKVVEYGERFPKVKYGRNFHNFLFNNKKHIPYGSSGNGAAMRVSPIGWYFQTIEEVKRFSKLSAEISHNSYEAIKGAIAIGECIFLSRKSKSKEQIKNYIETEYGYDLDKKYEHGNYILCKDSVPLSIQIFLNTLSYKDAVKKAILLGDDTDTHAAIAGSIAEAFYRHDLEAKIPADFIQECMGVLSNDKKYAPLMDCIRKWQSDIQNSKISHKGDGFIMCLKCKKKHWGKNGAAGIFIVKISKSRKITHILMQLRGLNSIMGGTWGVPGGALSDGESAVDGAIREAKEEAGLNVNDFSIFGKDVQDHGNWSFTTVIGVLTNNNAKVKIVDWESSDIKWVPIEKIYELELLPAFESKFDEMLELTKKLVALNN